MNRGYQRSRGDAMVVVVDEPEGPDEQGECTGGVLSLERRGFEKQGACPVGVDILETKEERID